MTDIKLQPIIDAALQLKEAEHDAGEELKAGNYRAGSTGLWIDGQFYGKCARKLLLRSKNIQVETIPSDKKIMFSGGLMNETVWVEDLRLGSDYNLKMEEEIPTEWYTHTSGTRVTGRPDIVLCDPKTDKPLLGLELKMAASAWTARDVIQGNPKFDHLTQAAHYMWQLNIPFKLIYTSYVNYPIAGWMSKVFPKYEELGYEYIEYKEDKGRKVPKNVKPFKIVYDLKWSKEGNLMFKREKDLTFTRSFITLQGIKDYFEELDKTQQMKKLPLKPKTVNHLGEEANWSICSYCPLDSVCKSSESNELDTWLQEINQYLNNNKE